MRILTWNCDSSLARKLDPLLRLEPDVAVVQECEEDLRVPDGYSYAWRGNNPRRGLGVLLRNDEVNFESFARSEWTYFVPIALPALRIRLLATWAYNHRANRFGAAYVGNPLVVLRDPSLSAWLREGRSIVAGDFNNSVVFERPSVKFAQIDGCLRDLRLESAYHLSSGEKLGQEKLPTFFPKNQGRACHIDYCFVHESLTVESVSVPQCAEWRCYSDHVPVIVDLAMIR
jgi:exonuclease III